MSNSTVVPSSEYGVTPFSPLATPAGSNGGIYNAGLKMLLLMLQKVAKKGGLWEVLEN